MPNPSTLAASQLVHCRSYNLRSSGQSLLNKHEDSYQTKPQRASSDIRSALASADDNDPGYDSDLTELEDDEEDDPSLADILASYSDSDLTDLESDADAGSSAHLDPTGPALTPNPPWKTAARRSKKKHKAPSASDPHRKVKEAYRLAQGLRDRHDRGAPSSSFRPRHAQGILASGRVYQMQAKLEGLATNPSPYVSRRSCLAGEGARSTPVGQEESAAMQLDPDVHPRVHELLNEGYSYVREDESRPLVILDSSNRIIAVKVRRPKDAASFSRHVARVDELMGKLHAGTRVKAKAQGCRSKQSRGNFLCWNFGTSFGGAQKEPMPLAKNWKQRRPRIMEFFRDASVKVVVKHVEACFRFWFPEVWAYYQQLNEKLGFTQVFTDADDISIVFAAQTLNLGPEVSCYFHRDFLNFPPGICTVVPSGTFNHRQGGQLVMVEPKLVIELQAGDVMMFPSSLITHGNVPLPVGQVRRSWVFYTAGGVVRWVDAGAAKVPDRELDGKRWEEYQAKAEQREKESWAALLTLSELSERLTLQPVI